MGSMFRISDFGPFSFFRNLPHQNSKPFINLYNYSPGNILKNFRKRSTYHRLRFGNSSPITIEGSGDIEI